jgi:hypothetical protein
MPYIFYKDLINEIALDLRYKSVSHILSNPYVSDGWKIVEENNPMTIELEEKQSSGKRVTLGMLKSMGVVK